MKLIDWSEKYPQESSLQIAVRQSTYCPCGHLKKIGDASCGKCAPSYSMEKYNAYEQRDQEIYPTELDRADLYPILEAWQEDALDKVELYKDSL